MISAVILTKNEEKNIEKCLRALSWCDEIIIVEDYSSKDLFPTKTYNFLVKPDPALREKLKIYKRPLNGDFSKQRNFGLEKAKGEWVLFIDADEVVSDELKKEILAHAGDEGCEGYEIKRKDKFMGKWLKYGETSAVRLLRLGRKESGKWKGKVHEAWEIRGKRAELKNPLLHERQLTISQFLERINYYSTLRAKELYEQGEKSSWFWIIAYPLAKFWQNYFLRLGFMDGVEGLMIALIMSFHSFLVRSKLYLLNIRR